MGSRLNFRPRQLDKDRPMAIVRDLSQLDTADAPASRDVAHNHQALDKTNESVKTVKTKKGKEIPVPEVRNVVSYHVDYLPIFRPPQTYIHGRGGQGYSDETFVEYDLDKEDEAWLEGFNEGQPRISPSKLETMLWVLEIKNASCTDNALAAAGASMAERMGPVGAASIDHMTFEQAMDALRMAVPSRDAIFSAVYEYWKAKRRRLGKPMLRKLQAPTAITDTNPFNVFRPRERINRPQTRRRRENNQESWEKLLLMKHNLTKAKEITELMAKRERKKRDAVFYEIDATQLAIKLRHEPKARHEAIEADYAAQLKAKAGKRPLGFEAPEVPQKNKKFKKKKKDGTRKHQPDAIAQLPPPPLEARDPPMRFCEPPSLEAVQSSLAGGLTLDAALLGDEGDLKPRIGRGGRLLFDRCDPWEWQPLGALEPVQLPAFHELPNPLSPAPKKAEGGKQDASPTTGGSTAKKGPGRPPKGPR